ncbi:MAG: DNA polymerase beta superfamily protein, partial [bacterium]
MKSNDFIDRIASHVGDFDDVKKIKWKKELENNLFHEGDELLYLCVTGSHLYGTNTKGSDIDIKGVFKPSRDSLIVRDKRDQYGPYQSKDEYVEMEVYSIHKFLNLLMYTGDSNAYDIMFSFTNPDCILYKCTRFNGLDIEKLIGIKPIRKGLIGYAYGQLRRYEVKGFNFNTLKNILRYFKENSYNDNDRLENYTNELIHYVWEQNKQRKQYTQNDLDQQLRIVEGEHDIFLEVNQYKKYPVGIRVKQFIDATQKWTKEYGARVKDNDDGVDWKSISHAYRVLDEIQCLIDNNTIKFPFDTADDILKIKQGKYPFKEVINKL